MQKICLIFIFVFSSASVNAAEKSAIVTVSALKIRATPSLTGVVVATVPRATVVEVLGFSKEQATVDNITGLWANVRTIPDGKQGWLFSGFVSPEYQYLDSGKKLVAWAQSSLPQTHSTRCEIVLYETETQKLARLPVTSEICSKFGFSSDLKYLAVDDGTYVYGTVHIYRVKDKKLLYSIEYYPREIRWHENTLQFNELLCDKDGSLLYEKNIFSNGKIQESHKSKREKVCGTN